MSRTYRRKTYNLYRKCPKWHNKLYHIRPFRRRTKSTIRKVLNGYDTKEDAIFDCTYSKPTEYYW